MTHTLSYAILSIIDINKILVFVPYYLVINSLIKIFLQFRLTENIQNTAQYSISVINLFVPPTFVFFHQYFLLIEV